MSPLQRLLREMHRRSLWQVLLIYIGASWAVIEAVQGLTEATGLPEWFPSFAVGLLMIGFPVVMATAFVQEGVGRGGSAPAPAAPDREAAVGVAPADESSAHRILTWRNAVGGGIVAMALWGVLATVWIVTGQPTGIVATEADDAGPDPFAALETVAVLPFDNLSPDEENAFFAAGIHEDILTQLSKIGALTIISRTSVLAYAETDKSLREIGTELGAGAILEGSVRRAGNRVRITTQLIDAKTDAHLWAETYDRDLDDVFRIQMEIATQVAAALEATLSPQEEARIAELPTGSLDAYDVYLRGREIYNAYTVEGNAVAIRFFHQAVQMDPEFALAWAGLGDAYAQAGSRFGLGRVYADSALVAAETAVRLGPELGEAHKARGLALALKGRRTEALEAYLLSAELSPSHHAAINNIGFIKTFDGRLDEALLWYRRAARIAPDQEYTITNTAEMYTIFGDYVSADEWLKRAEAGFPGGMSVYQQRVYWHLFQGDAEAAYQTALPALTSAPDDPASHNLVGMTALWSGRPGEAVERFRESVTLAPGGANVIHARRLWLAAALIETGQGQDVEALIDQGLANNQRFRDGGNPSGLVEYDQATAAALRGDRDGAIAYLAEAFDRGWRYAVFVDDPLFKSLWDDPAYQELMSEVYADIARMRVIVETRERAEGIR